MMRRALCERVGGYRVFNQLLEDYDLWLRLLSVGEPGLVTSVEYLYQISPGGIVYGAQAHSRLMMALVRQLHQERRNGGQEVTDWQATVEKLMPAEGTARASPAERQTAVIYDHGLYCLLVRDWAGYQEAILQAAQGHGAAAERARRQVRWLAKVPPLARWTYLFNVRNTVRRYWRPLPPGTPLPRFAV
jgi:hypothetical protein